MILSNCFSKAFSLHFLKALDDKHCNSYEQLKILENNLFNFFLNLVNFLSHVYTCSSSNKRFLFCSF